MKKFWNLMLAALVIFGAVACTEKEVAPEQIAGMSFTATIDLDETRTDVVFNEEENVWETVWTGNETLFVRAGYMSYPFKNSVDNKNVFTCATAPESIKGSTVTITLGHDDDGTELNSLAGKAGGSMKYQGVFSDNITISVNSAFLRFKSASDVALVASAPIFVINGTASNNIQLTAGDDVWVAIKQMYGVTLEAIIDGETVKSTKEPLDFVAKKIYNLGELAKFEPVASEWALVGAFSNWADKAMFTTPDANLFVLKNVEMKAAAGFLVRKPTTDWADKYGAGNVNYIKSNHYIATSKDGADMCLEADGTYDIYFNSSTKNLYVMVAGTDYASATKQTVSGEEPKQEEPEVTEKVVYLKPNSNWTQSNARFAAYFFGGSVGEKWVSMTAVGDGTYEAHLPEGYDYGCNIIFCRMNPSTTGNNWNNKWNQTADLKTPTDGKNLYTVAAGTWDKGGGTWSVK
ncbi:MAG: hypothetical protein J6Q36_01970 [Alistipes sp.]|nr:hypothetical protein [Alistipes sp.]